MGHSDNDGAAAWRKAEENAWGEEESENGKVQKHNDVHFMCANIFFNLECNINTFFGARVF